MKFNSLLLANLVFCQLDVPLEMSEDLNLLSSLQDLIKENAEKEEMEEEMLPRAEALTAFSGLYEPYNGRSNENSNNIKAIDNDKAINYLNLAATAYCDQKEIENWNCYNCKGYGQNTKEIVYISDQKLQAAGYVGVNSDHNIIVASFRGTSETKNWLTNLKILFTEFKVNGKVVTYERSTVKLHTGFNEATDALLPKFRKSIKDLKEKYPTYSVVFTGHSLGGALASLSAVKLAEENTLSWNQTKIVTFGQPRVGNDVFANYLNSKPVEKARVTTRGDIVTISPGRTLGYRHSQHIIHKTLSGQSVKCSDTMEDPVCYNFFKELSLEAHFIFSGQRINSNCKDPNTVKPQSWFQKKKLQFTSWWKGLFQKKYF